MLSNDTITVTNIFYKKCWMVGTAPGCRTAPLQSRWERRLVKPQHTAAWRLAGILWAIEMPRMPAVVVGGWHVFARCVHSGTAGQLSGKQVQWCRARSCRRQWLSALRRLARGASRRQDLPEAAVWGEEGSVARACAS